MCVHTLHILYHTPSLCPYITARCRAVFLKLWSAADHQGSAGGFGRKTFYQTLNEWKICPYMSALFVGWPSAESRWSSSSHNFLSFNHYFRKYFKLVCRRDVVMVTLAMFLPFTCMCFWVGNFTKVVRLCTTTYEVIHDCRKSEKHWCRVVLGNLITNHLVNKFPILWNQRFIAMFRKVILCTLSLAIWMACTYSPSFSKIHFHIIILNTVWELLLYEIFLKVKFIMCKFSWNTSLVFKSTFPLFFEGGGVNENYVNLYYSRMPEKISATHS
jgi:hypothetical protein